MCSEQTVESVLKRVRPFLQADGGDLELVAIDGDAIRLRLTGQCASCPQAQMTLHYGIESALRDSMPSARVVRVA